jgi:predicted deacylase
MHGDEQCGLAAIVAIEGLQPRGTVKLIVANPPAIDVNKRFIANDMNKCFPGREDGTDEDLLAFNVLQEVRDCEYVIDLHSCTSTEEPFAITTRCDESNVHLARCTGLSKLVLMSDHLKQNKALIDHHPAAISVECGIKASAAANECAKNIVLNVLGCLGLLDRLATQSVPEQFEVFAMLKVPEHDCVVLAQNLTLVKAGQSLAKGKTVVLCANEDCYPVLFGEESYACEGILGLVARKIR